MNHVRLVDILIENSKSAEQAAARGLKYAGWGKWVDSSGTVVAYSTESGLQFVRTIAQPVKPKQSLIGKLKSKFAKKPEPTEPEFTEKDEEGLNAAFDFLKKNKDFKRALVRYSKAPTPENRHKIVLVAMDKLNNTPHNVFAKDVTDTLMGRVKDTETPIGDKKQIDTYIETLGRDLRKSLKVSGVTQGKLNTAGTDLVISFDGTNNKSRWWDVRVVISMKKVGGKWAFPDNIQIAKVNRLYNKVHQKVEIPIPFEWSYNHKKDMENITMLLKPVIEKIASRLPKKDPMITTR